MVCRSSTSRPRIAVLLLLVVVVGRASSFTLTMMGAKGGRRKGALRRTLDGASSSSSSSSSSSGNNVRSANAGRGQEITGVTLPEEGGVKGWEFGEKRTIACARVDDRYYAVQGDCPRCAFDLWKGTVVTDEAFGPDLPRIACPTCSTTYSLRTGRHGPPLKREGLGAFVSKLAATATATDATKDAKAFTITRDEEGRVYCREN